MNYREFPPIADLVFRVKPSNDNNIINQNLGLQEPEDREVMAQIIGEEPNDSVSLMDLEYNFVRERDEKWHP